jgi:hypothetical protein
VLFNLGQGKQEEGRTLRKKQILAHRGEEKMPRKPSATCLSVPNPTQTHRESLVLILVKL